MDEKYKRGKIYTIRCRYDDTLIYVGSTIEKYLSSRMSKHRYSNKCKIYEIVNGDWDNWYIELYENYPCKSKQELEKREGEIIRLIGNINKRIEGRTHNEYIQNNREKIAEYKKQHYRDNREKIAEYQKEYYKDNLDKILERNKVLKRKKETCERCGFIGLKHHMKRHQQSQKCLNYNIINN